MEIPADFSSFIMGLFFLALFFAFSLIVATGIKCFLSYFGIKKNVTPENKIKRTRKPVRLVEIDPNEINRITVKKQ